MSEFRWETPERISNINVSSSSKLIHRGNADRGLVEAQWIAGLLSAILNIRESTRNACDIRKHGYPHKVRMEYNN